VPLPQPPLRKVGHGFQEIMSCHVDNCRNPTRVLPVLELRRKKGEKPRRVWLREVSACEDHSRTLTLDDFLSDEGFDKLTKHLKQRGLPTPSRRLTTLAWEELPPDQITRPTTASTTPDGDEELPF
jgi:hypothetical protein